jgi:hypothetical protein
VVNFAFSLLILHQKRRAVWRLAGDIRGEGAAILLRLWLALGWPDHAAANPRAGLPYGVGAFLLVVDGFLTVMYRAIKAF